MVYLSCEGLAGDHASHVPEHTTAMRIDLERDVLPLLENVPGYEGVRYCA